MRRSAVAAAAAAVVGDSLPPALLFPFKSKRFKEGFRGGFRVSRNFTSSFLVPSGNLGFWRKEEQHQELRKGPTFLASSFRKSLLSGESRARANDGNECGSRRIHGRVTCYSSCFRIRSRELKGK